MREVGAVALVLVLALWLFSGLRSQHTVGPDEATVQAQMTAVAHPTPSPTP